MAGILSVVVAHEWRRMRSEPAFRIGLVVFLLIFGYAAWSSASRVRTSLEAFRDARNAAEDSRRELRQGALDVQAGRRTPGSYDDPRSPAGTANGGFKECAILPSLPLAALSEGQGDVLPRSYAIQVRSRSTASNIDDPENPTALLAGRFDLSFLVCFLMPLLVLALSYDLVSGERELGTWGLLVSQPVSLRWVLLGKLIPRLLLVMGLVCAFSVLALWTSGTGLASPGTWGAYLLWLGGVGLYAAFWFALALLANTFVSSSAMNAIALSGAWLAVVMVLPAGLQAVASVRHPAPDRLRQVLVMRDLSTELSTKRDALVESYYAAHPGTRPAPDAPQLKDHRVKLFPVWTAFDAALSPFNEAQERARAGQNGFIRRVAVLSPPLALESLASELAGTGYWRWAGFQSQADAFQAEWRAFFGPRIMRGVHLDAGDYEAAPRFRYEEMPEGESMGRTWASFLMLVGAAAVPLGIAALRLRGLR